MPVHNDDSVCKQITGHPGVGLACSIPLGGLVGLVVSVYGYNYMMKGFDAFNDTLLDLKVDGEAFFDMLGFIIYLIVLANALVMLYGLREKVRIRTGMLPHVPTCPMWCVKLLVKQAINIVVFAALLVSVITFLSMEAVYVLFLALNASCDNPGATVEDIADLMGSKEGATTICDAIDGEGRLFLFSLLWPRRA